LDAGDGVERRTYRLLAARGDPRGIDAARVERADLPFIRARSGACGAHGSCIIIENATHHFLVAIAEDPKTPEARAGGRDSRRPKPGAVRVVEEISARRTRRIHVGAVDRFRGRRLRGGGDEGRHRESRAENGTTYHGSGGWNYE